MVEGECCEGRELLVSVFRLRTTECLVQRIGGFADRGEIGEERDDALNGLDCRDEEHLVENDIADGDSAFRREGTRAAEHGDLAADEEKSEKEPEANGEDIGCGVAVSEFRQRRLRRIGKAAFGVECFQKRERLQKVEERVERGVALSSDAMRVIGESPRKRGEEDDGERKEDQKGDAEYV